MSRCLLLLLTSTALLAQQPPPIPKPNPQEVEALQKFLAIGKPPDPAAVERGKQKFIATCSFCHGTNAKGGQGGPDLIRSTLVLHDNNGDNIGPVILHGRADKGMPAFPSTTPTQISDIAAFLKSRYQLAANRGSYQILNLVTGDAKAGEAYFNGEGGCSGCHSPTGDLAHIGTRLTPDLLQEAFLYPRPRRAANPEGFNRARETAVVTLPTGKTYSGVLNQLDDFSVTVTDQAGLKHTFPLTEENGPKVEVHDPLAAHLELLKKYSNADMHNLLAYLVTLK
jgi:mono/diheme cytochrome c family protein